MSKYTVELVSAGERCDVEAVLGEDGNYTDLVPSNYRSEVTLRLPDGTTETFAVSPEELESNII